MRDLLPQKTYSKTGLRLMFDLSAVSMLMLPTAVPLFRGATGVDIIERTYQLNGELAGQAFSESVTIASYLGAAWLISSAAQHFLIPPRRIKPPRNNVPPPSSGL